VHGPGATTIVIPTYNRAELLRQTLASVGAQTLPPAAVIVVDDGSTDGTPELLAGMEVTVVREAAGGLGPSRARDRGLARAETEFVCFLDSDDLLLPDALELLERALRESPDAPFAFGRSLIAARTERGWDPRGVIAADPAELEDPLPALFARNFVPSAGTLARRAALLEIGGYPTEVPYSEDHYLWVLLARLGAPVAIPAFTSLYRFHPGNRNSPALVKRDLQAYLDLADQDPRLAPAVPRRLAVTLCDVTTRALREREWSEAWTACRDIALRRRHRLAILAGACRHWRARRRWAAAGARIWDEDASLRDGVAVAERLPG